MFNTLYGKLLGGDVVNAAAAALTAVSLNLCLRLIGGSVSGFSLVKEYSARETVLLVVLLFFFIALLYHKALLSF